MNERAKEILSDCQKWLGEAGKEWAGSIKDSPEAHVYTLVLGGVIVTVVRWFL